MQVRINTYDKTPGWKPKLRGAGNFEDDIMGAGHDEDEYCIQIPDNLENCVINKRNDTNENKNDINNDMINGNNPKCIENEKPENEILIENLEQIANWTRK